PNPSNDGYLVTSWLEPGLHTFTARVWWGTLDSEGSLMLQSYVDDTVTARVGAAPTVPPNLAGTWERTVHRAGAPAPGSAGNPARMQVLSGVYELTFDRRWIKVRFPGAFLEPESETDLRGVVLNDDWTPARSSFHLDGAVRYAVHQPDRDPANYAYWCVAGGPGADYDWRVTGNTLTLTPRNGADTCGVRAFVYAGRWKRAV